MRACQVCKCDDREDESGDHWVVPEIRWIANPQSVPKNWTYKFFQGRHAQVRMACRDCINRCSLHERVMAEDKRLKLEAEGKFVNEFSEYYKILCEA